MDFHRLEQLEQRLNVLEASESIRNLIGRYATAADQKNHPVLMQPLFHENAVWCAQGFGEYVGRENIIQALSSIAKEQVLWSLHVMGQADIEIASDAKTATARWVLWELSTLASSEQTQVQSQFPSECDQPHKAPTQDHWLGGFYETSLSPDATGTWHFDRVRLNLTLNSPYAEGFQRLN